MDFQCTILAPHLPPLFLATFGILACQAVLSLILMTEVTAPAAEAKAAPAPTASTTTPGSQRTSAERGASPAPSLPKLDISKPQDFDGEVVTNDVPPLNDLVRQLDDYLVLDREGKTHTFRSLYNGRNSARRVLVIFVRHFFCGNCQDYLLALSEAITPEALISLPVSTSIVVIGCGDPALISMYTDATNCVFPVYTDPSRKLFDTLGMIKTLQLGQRPQYTRKHMASTVVTGVLQGLKQVKSGLATKAGDQRQVGGEFLFEPAEITSPIPTPNEEKKENEYSSEEKSITWCHRMKSTRDHTEIPELKKLLGLTS